MIGETLGVIADFFMIYHIPLDSVRWHHGNNTFNIATKPYLFRTQIAIRVDRNGYSEHVPNQKDFFFSEDP